MKILNFVFIFPLLLSMMSCDESSNEHFVKRDLDSIMLETERTCSIPANYSTPILFIETGIQDSFYFLTFSEPKIIRLSANSDSTSITELIHDEDMVIIDYAFNTSSQQLLLSMLPKGNPSSSQYMIKSYSLDGNLEWQQEIENVDSQIMNHLIIVPYGEKWAYVNGVNLIVRDKNWELLDNIELLDGEYYINSISGDKIYLYKKEETLSIRGEKETRWYAVTVNWDGKVIEKNNTEPFFTACTLKTNVDGKYLIAKDVNGELGVYFQNASGPSSKYKSLTLPQSFIPKTSVIIDGYYYIFGSTTIIEESLTLTENILVLLDEEFNYVSSTNIPVEDGKEIIKAINKKEYIEVFASDGLVQNGANTLEHLMTGQQTLIVYKLQV